jgi:hypothetical protein
MTIGVYQVTHHATPAIMGLGRDQNRDRSSEARVLLSTARSRWDATKDCGGSGL